VDRQVAGPMKVWELQRTQWRAALLGQRVLCAVLTPDGAAEIQVDAERLIERWFPGAPRPTPDRVLGVAVRTDPKVLSDHCLVVPIEGTAYDLQQRRGR